jgi:gliding motility-associated lipoprotein GldD
MKEMYKFGMGGLLISILFGCSDHENFIPKPATYLELNTPERVYKEYHDSCGYSFQKPTYFEVNHVKGSGCNRDIRFSSLNGVLHLSVIDMDTTLGTYVNYSIDKVDEHKIKATAIYDSTILRPNDKVYGTFFELQGNVASPFQFYMTDSTNWFMSGVVYFNTHPNYDSIKPTLDFVKKDLFKLMETISLDSKEFDDSM